ncbi:ser/Thr protein phosphatase-like protein family [Cucurbitaria berberidis CBS 394.84]|uniref:Ser/Thr protein phosphatase-like protein family n=1 Tax=Cucurbitaria berberidis CBS 394.84 TaxID=1168544 RepID=A0A9P4GL53_9PLEO|nr:ser/Thr protein phosphatase-like protein family [Cucurbitaria berberidis CBS 394.84]KAF1847605.1 ser/Thr protein phosphatase-like protein family [Cucurbitaria berberidis CBS 394.84]
MTYRDYPRAQNRPPPLIDLIPDNRDLLDVSDEEDSFYGKDDDWLISPEWQATIARTTDRIPRRIKRYSAVYLAVAFLFLVSWWTYLGPRYARYKQDLRDMDASPLLSYGNNVRPEFKGMIQVSDMDQQHLPKKHSRLIFVGDVHGCKDELEDLLKKVDFNHKYDHLVLTGDMIAKGPDSPGVIKLAQKLGASCVRGNWEDKLLLSIAEGRERHLASTSGPDDSTELTLDFLDDESNSHGDNKLRKLAKQFTKSEVSYLQQCPVILRIGQVPNLGSLVAVHAGLVPDTPLKRQDPFHVMNMRTIDLKTRIPSSKHAGTPWEKFWNHRQKKLHESERTTVIYGHNRKRGLNIQEYTYGLDTGCVNGERLTALVIDGHGKTEIVHVKCRNEMGYNAD